MFRCDLEVAAHVVADQLADVLGRLHRQVVAHATADQHLLDARQLTGTAIQADQRCVIGLKVVTDVREHTGRQAAGRLDLATLAGEAIHVGGRATEVGDGAGEAGHAVTNGLDLADHRFLGAVLDDAPFVLRDRTEGTTTETTALDGDGETDHFIGGDVRLAIHRVRNACVGLLISGIEFAGGQRDRRRVEPQFAVAVALHERAGIARIGFEVQHAGGVGVQHRIILHLLIGRQPDHGGFRVESLGSFVQSHHCRLR